MDETATGADRLLAALAAGAGGVHLALVPSHMDEWAVEGVVFAIVGWAQIVAGVALLVRRSTTLRMALAGGSGALIVLWGISRTTGFPVGPHSGHAETADFVDLVSVGLEVAVLVVVLGLPKVPARSLVFATALPLGVLALATVAIASPSARDHAHDAHGGHGERHDGAGDAAHDVVSLAAGHTHPDDFKPYEAMDSATFKLLGEQLQHVRQVTLRFPTVGDALAAGFVRRGSFVPGQGAHYFPPPDVARGGATPFDNPLSWLYAGTDATSPVVGLMYGAVDFAGPNDRFHYHTNVCLSTKPAADGSFPAISESEGMTEAECRAKGETIFIPNAGPLMHVWAVPGWESPIGVFSHDNPLVVCTDGQRPAQVTHGKGGCKGLS